MKQKIVIKVQMACEKCRVKAMTVGAAAKGVISLAREGADKDRLVVIGEGVVDSAELICKLRKKLCCYATLLSVEEVKPPAPNPPPPPPPPPPSPPPPPPPPCCSCSQSSEFVICHCHQYYPPFPKYCEVVCDENPSNCSIM